MLLFDHHHLLLIHLLGIRFEVVIKIGVLCTPVNHIVSLLYSFSHNLDFIFHYIEDNAILKYGGGMYSHIYGCFMLNFKILNRKSHKYDKRQEKSWDGLKTRKGGPGKKQVVRLALGWCKSGLE